MQVHNIFIERVASLRPFTDDVFIILDERTLEDASCLVSAAYKDLEGDYKLETQRADFTVACEVARYHDQGLE